MTYDHALLEQFVTYRLGLAMFNLCDSFEMRSFIHFSDTTGAPKGDATLATPPFEGFVIDDLL